MKSVMGSVLFAIPTCGKLSAAAQDSSVNKFKMHNFVYGRCQFTNVNYLALIRIQMFCSLKCGPRIKAQTALLKSFKRQALHNGTNLR